MAFWSGGMQCLTHGLSQTAGANSLFIPHHSLIEREVQSDGKTKGQTSDHLPTQVLEAHSLWIGLTLPRAV